MHRYLILLFTLLALSTNAQHIKKGERVILSKDGKALGELDANNRKQGVWKHYSSSGLLKSEEMWKDDKMHGTAIIYYTKNGRIQEQCEYFDGKKDGKYSCYFLNGQTCAEGEYDYGRKQGQWTYYNKASGEISRTGNYMNGKEDGEWKYYNSKGELTKKVTYKNGKALSAKKY